MLPLYLVFTAMTAVSVRAAPLEEKAGRLLMPTIDAAFVEAHAGEIESGLLGAGMLAWDKHDAAALKKLRKRLDGLTGKKRRFLLAVDHEGGPLFTQRTAGLTIFPGNMALAATGDEVLAREAARISAQELAALGIDMVFAPVADVNSDPSNPIVSIRAFSDSPEVVARFVEYAVKGYEDGGVIPVLKHFPGHGDTDTDSHTGLPLIDKSAAALEKSDLLPFRKAIAAGAQAVMTAHIRVPSLGADAEPATLSRAVMTGLLRGKTGFTGVLVSDSLEMAAVAKRHPPAKSAALAVEAGCDLLLTGRADTGAIRRALAAKVAEKTLDAAGARIAALEKRPADYSMKKLRPPSSALRDIADRSVTLLRDREGFLPLKGKGEGLLWIVFRPKRFAPEGKRFAASVKKAFPAAKTLFLEPNPAKADADAAMARARKARALVVSSYHWGMKPIPAQKTLIARLLQLPKPSALLSAMSPYDATAYPEAKTVLLTYGFTAASLEAAVRLVAGKIEPRGRLPVSLSERILRGDGLQSFSKRP